MKLLSVYLLLLLMACLLFLPQTVQAEDTDLEFGLQETIQLPSDAQPLTSFDISWVDAPSQTYFLADRDNKSIDIVDAKTDTFVKLFQPSFVLHGTTITFAGTNMDPELAGPDGVLEISSLHQLWVGDANSRVWIIDVAHRRKPKVLNVIEIAPGDPHRSDELCYDGKDKLILIANPEEPLATPPTTPFVSLVSTDTQQVVKTITFPDASNGLEQCVYDQHTKKFYLPVKSSNAGEVAVIDPQTLARESVPLVETGAACGQNGMALDPRGQHLLIGCLNQTTEFFDIKTKTLTSTSEITGSDEVWFDSHNQIYYLAALLNPGGPVVGAIDARTNQVIAKVRDGTDFLSTIAHSIAANRANDHVFVPLGKNDLEFDNTVLPNGTVLQCHNGCIGVYFDTED
jgi:hypothetical protein